MIWQDFAIGAAQLMFIIALLPTTLPGRARPPFFMCALTACGVWAVSVAEISLGAYWGGAMTALCAALWTLIAVQSHYAASAARKGITL